MEIKKGIKDGGRRGKDEHKERDRRKRGLRNRKKRIILEKMEEK
jgi:hypothetical protein